MCAISCGELDGNVSSQVIVALLIAMVWSKNAPTASLPRTPLPSGLVANLPMGSSIVTSSAIRASHPSRSPACTHSHDACEAASAGDFWAISADTVLPIGVGVADDAADVAALEHVLVAVVDLLQLVLPGDHVVEVEPARLVHRQQLRDVEVRVAATEDGALDPLLHQRQHRQVERDVVVHQAADGGENGGAALGGEVDVGIDVSALELAHGHDDLLGHQ